MKLYLNQALDFFKKHMYGKLSAVVLLGLMIIASVLIIRSGRQEPPLALSDVAIAISAGKVLKIEDTANSGSLIVFYKDGSTHTSRRDQASSFLEQMKYPPDYTTVLVEVYGLSPHAHETATFISNPCGEQGPVWAFSCSIENIGRHTTEAVKHAPQVRAWTPIPN